MCQLDVLVHVVQIRTNAAYISEDTYFYTVCGISCLAGILLWSILSYPSYSLHILTLK